MGAEMKLKAILLFLSISFFGATVHGQNSDKSSEISATVKRGASFSTGDYALTGSFGGGGGNAQVQAPAPTYSIGFDYHLSETWLIDASAGIGTSKLKESAGGKGGSDSQIFGMAFYYLVPMRSNIFLQTGPAMSYSHSAQSSSSNVTGSYSYTNTNMALGLNLRALAMINNGFGIFTTFGLSYGVSKTNQSGTDSTTTSLGTASYNAGVIFYLR